MGKIMSTSVRFTDLFLDFIKGALAGAAWAGAGAAGAGAAWAAPLLWFKENYDYRYIYKTGGLNQAI